MTSSRTRDAAVPLEVVSEVMQRKDVANLLSFLTYRERAIIEARFGLGRQTAGSLRDVGLEIGVTRERIRQIEAKTLTKLRSFRETKPLLDFIW